MHRCESCTASTVSCLLLLGQYPFSLLFLCSVFLNLSKLIYCLAVLRFSSTRVFLFVSCCLDSRKALKKQSEETNKFLLWCAFYCSMLYCRDFAFSLQMSLFMILNSVSSVIIFFSLVTSQSKIFYGQSVICIYILFMLYRKLFNVLWLYFRFIFMGTINCSCSSHSLFLLVILPNLCWEILCFLYGCDNFR